MNQANFQHFAHIPAPDIQRSIFDRSCSHKTSFNVGELIPIYCDEILPGDTVQLSTSKVVRLQTLLTPIMDNAYLDTYFFYVPYRLCWEHFKAFLGENQESAWIPQTEYTVPCISSPTGGFSVGTLADHFGYPVGVEWTTNSKFAPSSLPFRAYALIVNEFFRDENLSDPLNIPLGDANQSGSNGSNYISDVANGGKPFIACKYHDYFTSCLPGTQKGPSVTLGSVSGPQRVLPSTKNEPLPSNSVGMKYTFIPDGIPGNWHNTRLLYNVNENYWAGTSTGENYFTYFTNYGTNNHIPGIIPTVDTAVGKSTPDGSMPKFFVVPSNLYTVGDASSQFTVNELRMAFQLQRYYEKLARGGSRYTEYILSMYGTVAPDASVQRPEYLGGNRVPISVHPVSNQAQSEKDFLGDLGALSVTGDKHLDVSKSFTEPGLLIGLCVCRYDHTYTQGMPRYLTRRKRTDFYLPVFANIGEQPVYSFEIYADGNLNSDNVFGYQEAWADYRYQPNRATGLMRPNVDKSLATWHLADNYSSSPVLSDAWIREDKSNVDRVLAVSSSLSDQLFADFYFDVRHTRPMPMYSVPGLIDHN